MDASFSDLLFKKKTVVINSTTQVNARARLRPVVHHSVPHTSACSSQHVYQLSGPHQRLAGFHDARPMMYGLVNAKNIVLRVRNMKRRRRWHFMERRLRARETLTF